jgi:hypothetical protein
MERNQFPDYQPKRSLDTIHDYIGTWAHRSGISPAEVLGKIPQVTRESVNQAIELLVKFQAIAAKDPGKVEPGNMILGADREEYVPSEAELIVSELGKAIMPIVSGNQLPVSPSKGKQSKKDQKGSKNITFMPITFRHVDVMGSGRFFYARKGAPVTFTCVP